MDTESVTAKITADLVKTYDRKVLIYDDGSQHAIIADWQRMETPSQGDGPFLEVIGPKGEVKSGGLRVDDTSLFYRLILVESINDETGDAITKRLRNVPAQLIKLAMADKTRGKNALMTRLAGFGHFFTGDEVHAIDMNIYIDLAVQTFIDSDNPFTKRG